MSLPRVFTQSNSKSNIRILLFIAFYPMKINIFWISSVCNYREYVFKVENKMVSIFT